MVENIQSLNYMEQQQSLCSEVCVVVFSQHVHCNLGASEATLRQRQIEKSTEG